MTASIDSPLGANLRRLPVTKLRASLGAMASRGETSGPRVEATRAALTWNRNRATLIKVGLSEAEAEDLADQLDQQADTDADAEAAVAP